MGRLETSNMSAELRFVKPFRHQPSQPALPLGCVEMRTAMQRVAGEG